MLKVVNPATYAVIRELEEDTPPTLRRKYEQARDAQPRWAARPLEQRLAAIRSFRELLVSHAETLAETLTEEVGKPIKQSRGELNGVLGRIDFFLERAQAVLGDETVFDDPAQHLVERISHVPLGVVANVSAWNYPYFVGANVFVPALLAGNAVLYKPSEFASITGLAITRLMHAAGVPEDIFVAAIGGGAVGAALLKLPMDGVFFTGSLATGQKIAAVAAKRMIKVQLELGGKDPVYVCDDVDLKAAVASVADGAFYNTGQSCCSVERIYVHDAIHDEFVKVFVDQVQGYKIGDPMDDATYIGPLARQPQVAFLKHQIADARAKGAKLLTGGRSIPGKGNFFEPTVFSYVNHGMELMREESFGPIIGIQKVADDTEAVRLMNDTEYGLTAGVYTQEQERAQKILAQVNAGTAYWNCCDRVSPRLPWSGVGSSGVGVTLSTYGILTFTRPKAWHLRSN
jgi:acyl-CoA reductase-like NAD-dependent aldehyde dehydrogenase